MSDEQDLQRLLHEAEQEGYGLLVSCREGDKFRTLGDWLTIDKIQNDFSEVKLGPHHKDRTVILHCTDEAGEKRYLIRPIFNLYPVLYTDEHAAELFSGEETGQMM